MKPEELRQYIERQLDAISVYTEMAKLPLLSDALLDAKRKLGEQLKLAIVGKTKAGKSTLLNALLGISELPTGDTIVTGNVSVLLHVDISPLKKEMAVVHLENGVKEDVTLEEYRDLVDIRKPDVSGRRDKIVWFDVFLNHPSLKDMSIIDTPGDDSWLKDDSENTKAMFRDANRKPDVIAFVVRKEFGVQDVTAAKEYLLQINGAKHHVSGLNVIAVYSCCDQLIASGMDGCNWENDYRSKGNHIIENNRRKSAEFRTCFSKCLPIAGIFAMAAHSITLNDFSILQEIGRCDSSEYFWKYFSFMDYENMSERHPGFYHIFRSESIKQDMLCRLGFEPMKYIVWWCTRHPEGTLDLLRNDLEIYSNVPTLRTYIIDEHFKKLSLFYKITSVLPEFKRTIEKAFNQCVDIAIKDILKNALQACRDVEKEVYEQYGFLSVMRDYYDCMDYFDEEEWNVVMQTVAFCLSEEQDSNLKKELQEQWKDELDYYESIGDHLAVDSVNKLLKSIKSSNG